MRARAGTMVLLALVAGAVGALRVRSQAPAAPPFPHARHARLFPVCAGCHQGIATGDRSAFYPPPTLCAQCHDGRRVKRVEWTGPQRQPSNLAFSHPDHQSDSGTASAPIDCVRCHATGATPARMAVGRARAELCITCHAHAAPAHLAIAARCPACHVALARAKALPPESVAAFPRPESHAAADFVLMHGAGTTAATARAQCAICHARESCTRCHVNAAQVPAIAALESDRRVALLLAGKAPSWPLPASHRNPDWLRLHGTAAAGRPQSCASCHTQTGCRGCHTGEGPAGANAVIAQLPVSVPGGPLGALVVRGPGGTAVAVARSAAGAGRPLAEVPAADAVSPPSRNRVHPAGFATTHGVAAATNDPSCSACHQRTFCVQCHAGSTRPVFHPPAYLARHQADAYAAASDCSSCHDTQAFCRACHRGAGLQAQGRIDVAFHTGQPLWLLQHGQAAREGLEGCATCHAQQTCLRCHSTITWRINPHGPGFDANRMAKKSPLMCARCHVGPPPTR